MNREFSIAGQQVRGRPRTPNAVVLAIVGIKLLF
jgi:hypothetical protein